MTQPTIRVLVVDDHDVVRMGIQALLGEIEDIEVVGEAGDGLQAIEQAGRLEPDVILIDLVMPQMNGIEAIRHISARQPNTRLLVMTSFSGDDMVFPAIKAGALGFLLKDTKPAELIQAIRRVYRGEPSLHPSIARKLLQEVSQLEPEPPTREPLTEREIEVLRLVAHGLDNRQVAEQLVIAEVTVRSHVSHILDKLHLANRVQATLYALREGLTSIDDDP
ncbi:MAG: response regulator transcription factor [Anaerolineae bacterium]|nr:response regulator transcription factor [Anaerolineae bacterium]